MGMILPCEQLYWSSGSGCLVSPGPLQSAAADDRSAEAAVCFSPRGDQHAWSGPSLLYT